MAPFYKRLPSYAGGDTSFPCAASDDRSRLAKRVCCDGVRNSPVACRIGRLDCRTKGCAERRLLHADAARVRELCTFTSDQTLSDGVVPVRLRTHVQADACNAAVCAFAA